MSLERQWLIKMHVITSINKSYSISKINPVPKFRARQSIQFCKRGFNNRTNLDEIAAANSASNVWIIKNTLNKGYGIFAQKDILKDQLIGKSKAIEIIKHRDSHTVQINWNDHVLMNLPFRLINHSCTANVGIRDNTENAFDFYAVRDIQKNEELTWDYGAAEFESIAFEKCLCGSPLCRGKEIGFQLSHTHIRKLYGNYYAKYLHNWNPK